MFMIFMAQEKFDTFFLTFLSQKCLSLFCLNFCDFLKKKFFIFQKLSHFDDTRQCFLTFWRSGIKLKYISQILKITATFDLQMLINLIFLRKI